MFIGACVLLGALIACGHTTSYILAIAGFIIISVSLGGLIVKSIQAKDIKLLFHGIDSDYSWASTTSPCSSANPLAAPSLSPPARPDRASFYFIM